MRTATKPLTVRLPEDLYRASVGIAARRGTSLNALVQEGLAGILKTEAEARLYAAFGELGEDVEEADVEFALPAQREVVSRGAS